VASTHVLRLPLICAIACAKHEAERPAPVDGPATVTTASTGHTAHTAHTGAAPLEEGEWPPWTAGDGVAPYATWVLEPSDEPYERNIGFITTLSDVTGDDRPEAVFLAGGVDLHSGMPAPGVHSLDDGVAARILAFSRHGIANAGDVNGDGSPDLWLAGVSQDAKGLEEGCLFLGPVTSTSTPSTCVSVGFRGDFFIGDVDADGDGIADLISLDQGNNIEVHYGPFTEDRPSDHPAQLDNTFVLGNGTCGGQYGYWLGAASSPEQMIVVPQGGQCDPYLFDVRGPRRRRASHQDAIAWIETDSQKPVLNVNGDGFNAVAYAGTIYSNPSGHISQLTHDWAFLQGQVLYGGMGDLTGDGRGEIVVALGRFNEEGKTVYDILIVPARPDMRDAHAGDLGVLLGDTDAYPVSDLNEFAFRDMDGDGLDELFCYGSKAVWMWRGADIRQGLLDLGRVPDELTRPPR
jgi:hypothetical protein